MKYQIYLDGSLVVECRDLQWGEVVLEALLREYERTGWTVTSRGDNQYFAVNLADRSVVEYTVTVKAKS